MLIATFSNTSAKEFKNRIEKGINQKIAENPTNVFIKSQKVALQKADISTISYFCIKLVRENFQVLDIQQDFVIAQGVQAQVLNEKDVDMAMEYSYTLKNFKTFISFSIANAVITVIAII